MKKIIFLLLLVSGILSNQLRAQYITLPDTNFTNYLVANHPSCMVGGQLDTACAKLYSVNTIDIGNKNIHDIRGIEYFYNLKMLYCFDNFITEISALPPSLENLDCNRNNIENISYLPSTLLRLYCSNNDLDSLPPLPQVLQTLQFQNNNLHVLPALPSALKNLLGHNNNLSVIPPLPNGLKILSVPRNQITSFPVLPVSLTNFEASFNQLDSLPTLPSGLIRLICDSCSLDYLPSILPDSLIDIWLPYNNLSRLPALPNGLLELNCGFNQLDTLPSQLPPFLEALTLVENRLTELPPLPATLQALNCSNNSITYLPELPAYLILLGVSDNPLQCLPQLKKIDNFIFLYTNITCLPNYGQVTTSNPPLSSLPLCNFYNNNGCDVFYNITGKTYFDDNANCDFDAGDVNIKNTKVQLFKNGQLYQQAFTGGEGFYTFDLQNTVGDYATSIDSSSLPFTISCPDTGYYRSQLTAADTLFFDKDFGMKCKQGFDLGAYDVLRDITQVFRPASTHAINVVAGDIAKFYGTSCANVSGQVTVVMTGPATALSYPGLAPTTITGNTFVWDLADFSAVSVFNSFLIDIQIDTFSQAGDLVCFDVSVTPTTGDNDPTNNQLTHCYEVVNAYDPNNKEVYPAGYTDTSVHWLTYTINFQNTGNASALHVYLMDTLDSNLDESTIQLLTYSHDNYTQVLPGGIVKFNFPNINLPDSNANEPLSHGYVRYKIKMKDNLPIGTTIENTAHIYFDFNPAIVTNTTVNTLVAPLSKPLVSASATTSCEGDTITLQTDANALYTYLWRVNGSTIPNSNVPAIDVAQSGNYTVSVTDGISANVSDVQVITFNNLPVVSFALPSELCQDNVPVDLTQYASPNGGLFAGSGVFGPTDMDVSNTGTFNLSYIYTDGNGCAKIEQANTEVVICARIAGINGNAFSIYPNPASSAVSISATAAMNGSRVSIMDLNGKLLASEVLHGTETLVDISNLNQGVYVVTISTLNGQIAVNQKLVVIR